MNLNRTAQPGKDRRLELQAGQLWSFNASRGTEVCCVRGRLWVTQEGWWRDCVLLPGMSCVLPGRGKAVVSAETTASIAVIRDAAVGHIAPGLRVDPATVEWLVREASAERSREMRRLVHEAGRFIGAWMLALANRARPRGKHCDCT
jgi:hypothetical protein